MVGMVINPSFKSRTSVAVRTGAAIAFSAFLVSCAQTPASAPAVAEKSVKALGCESFADEFWDGLHQYTIEKKAFPEPSVMRASYASDIARRYPALPAAEQEKLAGLMADLFELLTVEAPAKLGVRQGDYDELLQLLAALELGDRTTPQRDQIQERIGAKLGEIARVTNDPAFAHECESSKDLELPEAEAQAGSLLSHWKATRHPAVYGALKSMATAYQSCEAGTQAAMNDRTRDVAGIEVVGKHPNKVGDKREIKDLAALLRTHYYLEDYRRPASSCFAVTRSPLIYDYGGKPRAGASQSSNLDFFRDAGTGTKVLGIDCSGYIFSSLATAGLKLKKSGRLKAVSVFGTSARSFKDPKRSGLDCFASATFKGRESLKPGDIMATNGHVLMIDTVGSDPFGIERFTKESECTRSNMDISRFDFVVIQSSTAKNAMGIGRMQAADYFPTNEDMSKGVLDQAVEACKAKVRGSTVKTKPDITGVSRHAGTSACKDRSIALANESCISSCSAP